MGFMLVIFFAEEGCEMVRTMRDVAIRLQDLNTLKSKISKISDDVYTEKKSQSQVIHLCHALDIITKTTFI